MQLKSRFSQVPWFRIAHGFLFAIGLAFVLSLGGEVQRSLNALLTSSETDLYAANFGDQLIPYVDLETWLLNPLLPIFIVAGLGLAFLLRQHTKARDITIIASCYFWLILSVIDVGMMANSQPSSFENTFQHLLFNAIGAPVLATYVILVGRISQTLLTATPLLEALRKLIVMVVLGCAGLLISIAVHQAFRVLLDPTPTKIELIAGLPLDGNLWQKHRRTDDGPSSSKAFLGSKARIKGPIWLIVPQNGNSLEWNIGDDAYSRYDLDISFYSGCEYIANVEKFPQRRSFTVSNVSGMRLESDSGPTQLSIAADSKNTLQLFDGEDSQFYLRSAKDPKKVDLTLFLSEAATLNIGSHGEEIEIFLSYILMNFDKETKAVVQAPRRLNLIVNDQNYVFAMTNSSSIVIDKSPKCEPFTSPKLKQSGENNLKGFNTIAGIKLTLRRQRSINQKTFAAMPPIKANGIGGWLRMNDLPTEDAPELFKKGEFSAFSLRGALKKLQLDGKQIEMNNHESLSMVRGKISGQVSSDGELILSGVADYALRNNKRLSQTRWEKIDSSVKLILLSGLFGLISSLFWLAIGVVKRNSIVRTS